MFNIKFIPSIKKKIINGKERYDFYFRLINIKKKTTYFIQADSNIWWKPKRIKRKWENAHADGVGWLFVQIGYVSFD